MMNEEEIYQAFFSTGSRFEQWEIVREIGTGATGKVFLAFRGVKPGEGSYAALKIMPANRVSVPMFQNFLEQEYKILANLDGHVNIVKLLPQDRYCVWKGGEQFLYLTLEYCPGGNLEEFRREYPKQFLPPTDVFLCLEQIARGCRRAHEKQIIHGDLCAENILLMRPNNLKVTDFGLSRIGEHTAMFRGKRLFYQAPETIRDIKVSPATDIWALGVLSYRLLTGEFPFAGDDEIDLGRNISQKRVVWPEFLQNHRSGILDSLFYFVERMLAIDPQKRPDSRELVAASQRCHQFMDPVDIEKFEARFLAHIEKIDKRPAGEISENPLPARELPGVAVEIWENSGERPKEAGKARRYRGLWNILECALIFAALLALHYVVPSPQKNRDWPNTTAVAKPSLTIDIVPILAPRSDRFAVNLELQDKSGPVDIAKSANEYQIFLHYRHEQGMTGKFQPPGPTTLAQPCVWELPPDYPDGRIEVWAEIYKNRILYLKSKIITITVEGVYQDREEFKVAAELESEFKDDEAEYARIAEAFDGYCTRNPEGLFREIASRKLRHYHELAAKHQYRRIGDMLEQAPTQFEKIADGCRLFLEKYPETVYCQEIEQIQMNYRKLLVPAAYRITLVQGCSLSDYADSYVKVYRNGNEIYTSPVAKNSKNPLWNAEFKITWKVRDTLKVELWNKNLYPLGDELYFRIVDNHDLSIKLLSRRIGEGGYWVEFKSNFPELYPPSLQREFERP